MAVTLPYLFFKANVGSAFFSHNKSSLFSAIIKNNCLFLIYHYIKTVDFCRIIPLIIASVNWLSERKGSTLRNYNPFFISRYLSSIYIYIYICLPQTLKRAISLQKVHLWMEISAGCPIVADAVWLRWTGYEMSRAACGRCNRYCPIKRHVLYT